MPADLGTKVLAVQKFNQHQESMGMFVGILKHLDEEEGARAAERVGTSQRARENALKAIILMTKLALAKGEKISTALVVREENQFLPISSGNSYSLIVFVAVIFCIGVLFGACIMGMLFWKQVDKITVVNYKGSIMNTPAFLWKVFEKNQPEDSSRSNAEAIPDRRRPDSLPTSNGQRGAAGTTQAAGAAGVAAASSSAAAQASRAAGSGGSTAGANPVASGATGSGNSTAGAASSASGSGLNNSTAGASSRGAAGASERESDPGQSLRSRRSRNAQSLRTLYTTPFGAKYHVDRNCHGLRNASQILETPRCRRCGPQSDIPQWELYAIGHGFELHVSYEHCRDYGSDGPLRAFNPCAICCVDLDVDT